MNENLQQAMPALKRPFVIVDPRGQYFRDYTASIPACIHSFTDAYDHAWKFATLEEAQQEKARLLDRLYDFGGSDKVPKDYLRIAQAEFKIVG